MSTFLILLAAGDSKRLKSRDPKPFILINKKTLIDYSIDKFLKIKDIKKIIVVFNKKHKKRLKQINNKNIIKIEGGKTRAQSTLRALKVINKLNCSKVLIHDAARPNVSVKLIKEIIRKLKIYKAVVPAIKVKDSIKLAYKTKHLLNIDRENLFLTQTPQGFRYKDILNLHNKYKTLRITDDAS